MMGLIIEGRCLSLIFFSWTPTNASNYIYLRNKHILSYFLMLLLLLFSCPVMSDSLWPHGLQCGRPPCPSPSPEVCPSSYLFHRWCHPAISFSVTLFSFCPQSFPASGTFPTFPQILKYALFFGSQALFYHVSKRGNSWAHAITPFWSAKAGHLEKKYQWWEESPWMMAPERPVQLLLPTFHSFNTVDLWKPHAQQCLLQSEP